MKVLVTGGAGYIGSHTVRQLVKTGADVTVLDNMVYGHAGALVDPEVKLVKGDLGDASVVYPLLMKGNFDAVIHFAAFINVGESVQNPLKYYMNNIARPLVLLGAMQAAGVKRFVFSSTCATYGVPTQIPIPETEKQDPIRWRCLNCGYTYEGIRACDPCPVCGKSAGWQEGELDKKEMRT